MFIDIHPRRKIIIEGLVLALLLTTGLALRLYRLEEQSLWVDETPSIMYLTAPTPQIYFWLISFVYAEQSPLYYYLQYYWAGMVGAQVVLVRLLPVIFGTLAIPALYVLARMIFNKRAAMIAILCLVLSPQHIWGAQEIRPYVFMYFCSIVSCLAFCKLLADESSRGRMGWLLLNVIVNVILMWTHILCGGFIAVQALVIFFIHKHNLRYQWVLAQILLLTPWLYWFLNIPYFNDFSDDFSIAGIFLEMFGDDAVGWHALLWPDWKTLPPEPSCGWLPYVLSVRFIFDGLLFAVSALGVVIGLLGCVSRCKHLPKTSPPHTDAIRLERSYLAYLILLAVAPILFYGIIGVLWHKPLLGPMYTLYTTTALYCLIGAVFASFSKRSIRGCAIIFIILLYGYQLLLYLPFTNRADWKSASDYVLAHSSEQELVIHMTPLFHDDNMRYYLQGSNLRLYRPRTPQGIIDAIALWYVQPENDRTQCLWVAIDKMIGDVYGIRHDYQPRFEAYLHDAALHYDRYFFPGHYNVYVYRITRDDHSSPENMMSRELIFLPTDWDYVVADLGLGNSTSDITPSTFEALRREVGYWPPVSNSFQVGLAMAWLQTGDLLLAEAMARHIVQQYPSFGMGYMALGFSLHASGKSQSAYAAFKQAFSLHRNMEEVLGELVDALCLKNDPAAAREQQEYLQHIGFIFADHIAWLIQD